MTTRINHWCCKMSEVSVWIAAHYSRSHMVSGFLNNWFVSLRSILCHVRAYYHSLSVVQLAKYPAACYPRWKADLKACLLNYDHRHLMTTNARKTAIWKMNSEGCKLCVLCGFFFFFFAGSLLHRKSLLLPCQSWATHQPVSHRFAPNPLTVLQTAEMDAYTVESMKLKGTSLINWQQAPQDREAGDGMINLTWGWSAGAAEERLMDVQQGRMFGCKKKKNVRCVVCSLFHLGFACLYCVHTFCTRYYLKYNKSDVPSCSSNLFLLEHRSEFINHSVLIGVFLKCTGCFMKVVKVVILPP